MSASLQHDNMTCIHRADTTNRCGAVLRMVQVCEVITTDIKEGNPAYLKWLHDNIKEIKPSDRDTEQL
jgi:uncharacterized protein involved in tolerance to divalent cations